MFLLKKLEFLRSHLLIVLSLQLSKVQLANVSLLLDKGPFLSQKCQQTITLFLTDLAVKVSENS